MKISSHVRIQLFLSILFFAGNIATFAQIPGLEWVKLVGEVETEEYIEAVATKTDLIGNVYTTGEFRGQFDFNPGVGTFELTAIEGSGFVTKLDANGNFAWAIQLMSTLYSGGSSITPDEDGNLVVVGYFQGTTDFDPGPGIFEITAQGEYDGFVLKLSSNGDFIFAKKIEGADYEFVRYVDTDISNNIYITGFFEGTTDFDPSDGLFELTAVGDSDAFLCKLDADGNFEWAKSYGDFNDDGGVAVEIDFANDVYVMGEIEDSDGLGNYEVFVNKLDAAGNSLWYKSIGGSDPMNVHSLQTDASGNIYFAGTFNETLDFDPDATTFELTGDDDFICKWDADGAFIWAKVLGFSGLNSSAESMDVDIHGNIFFTGYFFVKVDMDPGPGVAILHTTFSDDQGMFVLKLDNNGDYVWAQGFNSFDGAEGGGEENGNFITTDVAGNIYMLGIFSKTVNFGTGTCTPGSLTTEETSSFILKLAPTSVPSSCFGIIEQPVGTVSCQNQGAFLVALAAGTSHIAYRWQKFDGTTWMDIFDQEADEESSQEGYEGSDTPYFTVTSVQSSGSGDFRCKISGDFVGDAFSDVVTLTYLGSTDIPFVVANSGCGPGRFLISAFGATEGNYKWYDASGTLIDGQVNSTYTTPFISSPTKFSVAQGAGGCISSPVEVEVNTNACASVPGLVWAAQPQVTPGGSVQIGKMDIDASGNIYAVGDFTGTVDFDAGPGTSILSTAVANEQESFVIKLTSNRDVVWVRSLNNRNYSQPVELSLDGLGSIYVTGGFIGTVDFDPGVGIFPMTSTGDIDMFITKLTTNGDFVWAKRLAATTTSTTFLKTNTIFVRSIASDGNGVYTTGNFSGTVDFDPNIATQFRSSAGSASFSDIFISKLDPNGDFSWAFRLGRTSATDVGRAIEVDAAGNVYSAGTFSGTVDFDPGASTANLIGGGATDLYIHKLSNAGIFQWAQTVGGVGVEIPYALALDDDGNPHLAGTFGTVITNQTVDFDAGAGVANLISNQGILFILKLTPTGEFTWAKNFGGTVGAEPSDITVDAAGNVLMIGASQGLNSSNPDFDPGAGVYLLNSNVNRDIFVTQLDVSGNFSWAYNMASTGYSYNNTEGFSIVTDTDGSIYTSGSISYTSDLDPGHCVYSVFSEDGGSFIQKIKYGVASLCFNLQPLTVAGCAGTTETISALATGTTNITYQWQKLNTVTSLYEDLTDVGVYNGTSTTELNIDTSGEMGGGTYQCKVTGDNAPDKVSSPAAITVYALPPKPVITSVSTSFCEGGNLQLNAPAGFAAYAWSTGETTESIVVTIPETYTLTLTDANGCTSPSSDPVMTTENQNPAQPIVTQQGSAAPCVGESVTLSAPSNFTYLWSTNETTQQIQVNSNGVYSVIVTDNNGCSSLASAATSISFIICTVNQPPVINASSLTITAGSGASLNLTNLISDPDNNLDLTTLKIISQPTSGALAIIEDGNLQIDYSTITFTGTDILVIQVCDLAGSCTQQQIAIEVVGDVEIYNALSPNGDGLNDVFIIQYINSIEETSKNKVTIYNRWGDEVFSIEDYDNDQKVFAGLTNSGKALPTGTYFYKIEFNSARSAKNGYIYLKR